MAHAKRTILLIEDEESITTPLAEALERDGFHTEIAHTVADGLAKGKFNPSRLGPARHRAPGWVRAQRLSRAPHVVERPDHHPLRPRRGGRPRRRPRARADDYVVKPFSAREVIARVRAVLRRRNPCGRARRPDRDRQRPARPGAAHGRFAGADVELARKEFDLLALLMQEAGTVVTRERLIDEVWDVNWFGSTKTLDVHVSALRKKLDPSYIHTVRGVGFRFVSPEEVA